VIDPSHRRDVIIIGAGAAGLFCAAECGRRGRSVLVLDHAKRPASKVLVSGGGRCNFTNLDMHAGHYLSRNPHFCKSALARFTPRDILSFVEKYHIAYYEKEAGQMFCVRSSRDIAAMLERECREGGVKTLLGCRVKDIRHEGGFLVTTEQGEFCSHSLVIATGGLSYANLGATGFGHDVARKFGLKIIAPRPALVPFVLAGRDQKVFGELAGVSHACGVRSSGREFRGSLLFTHKGLSGPAALQASLYWETGMPLEIDLLPDADILQVFLERRRSRVLLPNLLAEHLPKRLALAWCEHRRISKPLDQTSVKELRETAKGLHEWEVVPKGTEGYATAEVTAGGVDTDELSSRTMEAKKVPALYFIGEVVDVTGELGGYNLHWAWASGHAAGQHA
jgi:predicted Rossmann fold flavoprotein